MAIIGCISLMVSILFSTLGVGWSRRLALNHQIIDIPNERSSHKTPTPRGGGLSIVMVVLMGTTIFAHLGILDYSLSLAILVGGGVAFIGFVDDWVGISPLIRASIHILCASLGLFIIGGIPPLDIGLAVVNWMWFGQLIGIVGIVWMINLYNFMDGIDGLAGSQAIFIFSVSGLLLTLAGIHSIALICTLLVGACFGFLPWNWPPAKIFMGDVASGFLGYMIAILAVASNHQQFSLWVWLILIDVFFVDSTLTLARRVLQGKKWYHPHRSHAYQHLANTWASHLRVTMYVLSIDVVWLLPLAIIVYLDNHVSLFGAIIASLPLIWFALQLGAGIETQ